MKKQNIIQKFKISWFVQGSVGRDVGAKTIIISVSESQYFPDFEGNLVSFY